MDEIIDVLDENTGEKTGQTISKNEAHQKGIWHGAIHILIINKEKTKIIIQKRCEEKKLYPNTWDVSVGGHISSGEDAIISAKRELEEELGLNANDYNLELLEIVKEQLNNDGVISNEFIYTFVIYADIDILDIKVQKEEVSDVKWITKKDLIALINEKKVVPHNRSYQILSDILK
jgi:isopentenyldiphosphate isomerase